MVIKINHGSYQKKVMSLVEEVAEIFEKQPINKPVEPSEEMTSEISSKSIVNIIKIVQNAIQEAVDNDPKFEFQT